MSTNEFTPPPKLLQQWEKEAIAPDGLPTEAKWQRKFATLAAQWGADQELEACVDWMKRMGYWGDDGKAIPALRADRRPKLPSLKEQALAIVEEGYRGDLSESELDTIRRALQQLDD